MLVEQLALFQRRLVVYVAQILVVIIDAQPAVDRPPVDLVGLFVDRSPEVLDNGMSFHEMRHHIGPFVQLVDVVHVARLLRDHQVALVVRFDQDVDQQKIEQHKAEQRTAGQELAVMVQR